MTEIWVGIECNMVETKNKTKKKERNERRKERGSSREITQPFAS